MERLGQIVIGAGIEAGHLFAPGAAGGQDEHGRGQMRAPPGFQHRSPVDFWQAKVEYDGVVGLRLAQEPRLLAIRSVVDGIVGVGQSPLELPRQIDVIFDKKNPHEIP